MASAAKKSQQATAKKAQKEAVERSQAFLKGNEKTGKNQPPAPSNNKKEPKNNKNNSKADKGNQQSWPGGMLTPAGLNFAQGTQSLADLAKKYRNNELITGQAVGGLVDAASTQANLGLKLNYDQSMASLQGQIQAGQEKLKTGNALQLMGAEGAILKGLQQQQGQFLIQGKQIDAGSMRYAADQGLKGVQSQTSAQRYAADQGLKGIQSQTSAQRYGAELGLKGVQEQASAQRYGFDRDFEGRKYTADQQLAGTRYGFDSQERQIGLQGGEDRKTQAQRFAEERAMRADARGAIRSQGARFYG